MNRRPRHERHFARASLLRPLVRFAALVSLCANAAFAQHILNDREFRQIGEQGFGERGASRAWSQAYFQGHVYIGTNFNFLCIVRAGAAAGNTNNPEVPVSCEERLIDNDLRGRIYRYDPATKQVELVYVSPTIDTLLSDGSRVKLAVDSGYRTMQVVQEADGTEALYVGTFTSTALPQPPARILRTIDGQSFDEIPIQGSFALRVRSYRSMTLFKDRFYVLALTTRDEGAILLESLDPSSGVFRIADGPGFDPSYTPFDLEVFAGYLYVGSFTPDGFELIKTAANGRPPYVFHHVLTQGAYRGAKNQAVLNMGVFKDYLYIGSGIYFGSLTLIEDFKPAASEILRVAADDSWDIIAGDERATPDGYKVPLSGRRGGFGNAFTQYLWQLVEHDGVLYAGTIDTAVLAQYAQGVTVSDLDDIGELSEHPQILEIIDRVGPDEIADVISAIEGGFDLWATTDGINWELVSRTGFGDPFSWGIRKMLSTPHGLFVGSDNPFFGLRLFLGQPEGTDTDGDSFADAIDNCPLEWNLHQADLDGDGIGDVCDDDLDGDCLANADDSLPRDARVGWPDMDRDGVFDECDPDVDGDGVRNLPDNCPLAANANQRDTDHDGTGDACEEPDPADDGTGRPQPDDGTGNAKRMCGAVGWALPGVALTLLLARIHTPRRRLLFGLS